MNDRKIHVILVSPLPPPIGGITSWTMDYINQMPLFGVEVTSINSSVIGNRLNDNTHVNMVDELKRFLTIKKQMKQQTKSHQIDVIHYNASCFTLGIIRDFLLLHLIAKKIPIVYHCHCNLDTNINNSIARFFFRKISKFSKAVLTMNQNSYKLAKEFSDHVYLLPNFIEQVYVQKSNVNKELKNIVFVGRISEAKGVREILSAANELSNINFHFIGPDDSEMLHDCKLKNIIAHGAKNHTEVIEMMQEMDALILPSYSEGFPLVVLEAMACGLPIIATPVGSIPAMIENKGGILLKLKDSQSIVNSIKEIENPQTRIAMLEYNLNKVKTEYLSDIVFKQLIDIYIGVKI